jgi:recombination protein RecA
VAGSKGGVLKDGDTIYGHRANIKAVKNKVAMPFRESIIDLHYATGFQANDDLIDHALKIGVLTGTSKFVINGTGSKYNREELPLDTVKAAVDKHYADLVATLTLNVEDSDEENDEESTTSTKG